MSKLKYLIGLVVIVIIGLFVYFGVTGHHTATFQLGDLAQDLHTARVADNPFKRAKGLSGVSLDSLKASHDSGMLFVFDTADVQNFWMKGMEFNLDFIWLKDGKVVKIDENVPAPVNGGTAAEVSSTPLAVNQVIELPAGGATQYGYAVGQTLHINLDGAK